MSIDRPARKVREIRATDSGGHVRLEPPVNKVLAVSRGSLASLLKAYRGK